MNSLDTKDLREEIKKLQDRIDKEIEDFSTDHGLKASEIKMEFVRELWNGVDSVYYTKISVSIGDE